jgi:hypothetical protein
MATKKIKQNTDVQGEQIVQHLKEYKIGATIRTGDYSNIVAEFTFEGGSIDDAIMMIDDKITFLYEKYHNFLDRPKTFTAAPIVVDPPTVETNSVAPTGKKELPKNSYEKAEALIEASKNQDSLIEIENRIKLSMQLTEREKKELANLIATKKAAYGTV